MWSITLYAWCVCLCAYERACANEQIPSMDLDSDSDWALKIEMNTAVRGDGGGGSGKWFNRFPIDHENPRSNNGNHLSLIRPVFVFRLASPIYKFTIRMVILNTLSVARKTEWISECLHCSPYTHLHRNKNKVQRTEPFTFQEKEKQFNHNDFQSISILFLDYSVCQCNWKFAVLVHCCLRIAMQNSKEREKYTEIYIYRRLVCHVNVCKNTATNKSKGYTLRQLIKFGTVYMYICALNICAEFRTLRYVYIFLLYHDYFTRFIASDRHIWEPILSSPIHSTCAQCHTVRQVFNSCIYNTRSTKNKIEFQWKWMANIRASHW